MFSPIYLDHHATTPCDPRVVEAMLPYFTRAFANPSSPHEAGGIAASAVEQAREQVAALLGGETSEIVFTSGATESNNLAILGAARRHAQTGGTRRRLVTTSVEHKAVLEPMQHLAQNGWEVVILPVDRFGKVDLVAAGRSINSETLLVSIQAANHEIGTIQPLREIAEIAHERGALLHCDAAQACGRTPVDVNELNVDLLSLSGHKLYGPKGIGALWLRSGPRRLLLEPLCFGGGQEGGLRPGTLPVQNIVGLGKACDLSRRLLSEELHRVERLRFKLEEGIVSALPGISRNGAPNSRIPGSCSLTFQGVEAEALLANLPDIIVSTGSACESGTIQPSRVLHSIGLSVEAAFCTLRFCLGRFSTVEEVGRAITLIINTHRILCRD